MARCEKHSDMEELLQSVDWHNGFTNRGPFSTPPPNASYHSVWRCKLKMCGNFSVLTENKVLYRWRQCRIQIVPTPDYLLIRPIPGDQVSAHIKAKIG